MIVAVFNRLRLALVVTLPVVIAAGWPAPGGAAEANAQEVRMPTVTVATAERAEIVARVSVSGTLVPREEVLVNTEISGYAIEKINVEVGDRVTTGDVLAVLNDRTLAAQLAQAEAELARANAAVGQAGSQIDSAKATLTQVEAALERTQKLRGSGNASQATLDQSIAAAGSARAAFASAEDGLRLARAQLAQAASQRDLAALNLSRTQIRPPVDGIVSARNARLGAIVAAGGEPMFRVIRDGEIEVEAEVIETALGAIATGDPADMTIAGIGGVKGVVRLISPTVDRKTRLGTIRISLHDGASLRAGIFASGWIVTDRREAVTVPSAAVLIDGAGTFVQVVRDGVVEKRRVTAGLLSRDGKREIVSGLDPGTVVMARAGAFFRDGDRVNPVASGTAAGAGAPQ